MGKGERNRQQNARAKVAAQQAAAHRADVRRRVLLASGSIAAVLIVVVVLLVINVTRKPSTNATGNKSSGAVTNAALANQLTSVPASALNAVGAGPSGAVAPLKQVSGATLTSAGKPEVLYMGAEYCPYCAAERWALTVALSRFGTFSNLRFIHSSSTDVYAHTPTLTYYKSGYTSKYVSFVSVELYGLSQTTPLQKASKAQLALMNTYTKGAFPFADIAGNYVVDGAQFMPTVLGSVYGPGVIPKTQLTWKQTVTDLNNPNSQVGQTVLAAANHITAAICHATNGQPGTVCDSPAVKAVSKI